MRIAMVLLLLVVSMAADAQRVLIGQSLDLSGASSVGKDFSSGIRTYIDWVNTRGGVRGRRIELIQLDDTGTASAAVANVSKLINEDNVVALIGPTSSEALLAIADSKAFVESSLAMIGGTVGAQSNRETQRIFRIRATAATEVRRGLDHLMLLSSGAPLIINARGSDSEALVTEITKSMPRFRISEPLTQMTDVEFAAAPRAKVAPSSIIVTGDAITLAATVKRVRQLYGLIPILGFSSVDHRTLGEMAGRSATGVLLTQVMPSASKSSFPYQREHRQLMKQFRDEAPTLHTLEGYLTARALVSALERVDGEVTALKVLNAFRSSAPLDFGDLTIALRDPTGARFVDISAISSTGALLQ